MSVEGGGVGEGLTVAATQTGGEDGDLCLARLRGPEGAVFDAKVSGAVEDSGCLGGEGNG